MVRKTFLEYTGDFNARETIIKQSMPGDSGLPGKQQNEYLDKFDPTFIIQPVDKDLTKKENIISGGTEEY